MTTTSSDVGVVVVGSGIAGRMAALRAAQHGPVALITDGPLDRCNSIMAQGGIHAPVGGDAQSMAQDIIDSARIPVERQRAIAFASGAAEMTRLLQRWGLQFDREPDGTLRRRIAGGMSQPRVLTAGDEIGKPLLKVLRAQLEQTQIEVRTHTRVLDVVPGGDRVVIQTEQDELRAQAVVIATGGASYQHAEALGERTTNPRNANHVLYERLVARGAQTAHTDCWQYQPYGLVDGPTGPPGRCVPETVAALGPRLLDRFGRPLCELPIDRLALTEAMFAARDRAIRSDHGIGFLLTLSDLDDALLESSYPKLHRTLEQMGGERDVLVWPFLHYQLGGVAYGTDGATSLSRVYAAGEVTGGLHGRNRLMGAGITDALVHGWRAGAAAARTAYAPSD